MLFDPRETKVSTQPIEIKNLNACVNYSFSEHLFTQGQSDLGAYATIRLYMDAMPFFNAVNMRAEAFSEITPRLWDTSTKKFIEEHPALDLLKKPNADMTRGELFEQIASFYDITGDTFLVATGRIENPPLELATVPPQNVTFGSGNKFGILHVPDVIWVTSQVQGQSSFIAEDDIDKGIRFYSRERDKELWHMRTFNPLRSTTMFRGMSRARPIWLEIQQYISGNNTNWSMLKRGTRLSMAWVNNRGEELTDKQWDRMQEEAQKYSGDMNAGGTPVLDGMDVKTIQQTNRDMEFKDLQEATLGRISTVYRIPLALLLSKSMTLNNLETAMLQFFDASVLPLTKRIYGELTKFLLPRYPGSENLEFRYNESDITALRIRMIESAKSQQEIGVNTTDEIRSTIGYEPLADGGDAVMIQANLIPLGSDQFTDDNLTKPGVVSKYRELLLQTKQFTEQEIENLVKEQEL